MPGWNAQKDASKVTHAEFDGKTNATDAAKAFKDQIKGRTILVTGVAPKGIGEGTVLAIASGEPKLLVLASRTQSKMDEVVGKVKEQYPGANVKTVVLDLSSVGSIENAAAEVSTAHLTHPRPRSRGSDQHMCIARDEQVHENANGDVSIRR